MPRKFRSPRVLDMNFIRNFMLVIGPISSLFDFLTFYVMLAVLKADEMLFQTGWFVESLTTQVLVIFIIRTRGNPAFLEIADERLVNLDGVEREVAQAPQRRGAGAEVIHREASHAKRPRMSALRVRRLAATDRASLHAR